MNIYDAPVIMIVAAAVMLIIAVIGYLYYNLYRYKLQAINAGLEDEIIKKEYNRSTGKLSKAADIMSAVFTVLLLVFFGASFYAGRQGNYFPVKGVGTLQVVASSSMSHRAQSNTYLEENNLTNQFDTYDIIAISPVEENGLQLYDVAVYEKDEMLIVHRIVDITEKDGVRYYSFRGDANNYDDSLPVARKNIIGVYNGFRIPGLGILVIFLQSALGYVAMGLVLVLELISPVFEKKIDRAIVARLKKIGYIG